MKIMAFNFFWNQIFFVFEKLQCILFLNSSFGDGLSFLKKFQHYDDILFKSTFFILFMWQTQYHHSKSIMNPYIYIYIYIFRSFLFLNIIIIQNPLQHMDNKKDW
jgi:hypothetical protein